jgi:signal transduction histidine kinase
MRSVAKQANSGREARAATGPTTADGSLSGTGPTRHIPPLISISLAGLVGVVLWVGRDEIPSTLSSEWEGILFWGILILAVNLIDFDIEPLQFTLDMPLLLAIAMLYPPLVAAILALVASTDVREFRGTVSFSRAIFNRSQIALSVLAAGLAFEAIAGPTSDWLRAFIATIVAMAVFYVLNAGFVAVYVITGGHGTPMSVMRRLAIGRPLQYALTYFGYGVLALVLVQLFREVGPWSVTFFLIPIVVAHLALVRAENLKSLADSLKARERLLELLSDRMANERRDERLRIAAGLHDDIIQSLIRVSQLGFFLKSEIPSGTQAAQDANELVQLSEDTLRDLREVVGDLRKSPVGRGGLVRTLKSLTRDLQIQTRVPISVDGPAELRLRPESQLAAYHVAKEAVLNALKHAQASSIQVIIRESDVAAMVEVIDDGAGFEPEAVDESVHFGLGLLRERIQMLGGSFELSSRKGAGTRLLVTLPTNPATNSPSSSSAKSQGEASGS